MNEGTMSRRGFLGGVVGAALTAGFGRALMGCGGPDVSVNIRRVDANQQGGVIVVRASVAFTNHKNVQRSVSVNLRLNAPDGTLIGQSDESLVIQPAELICYCYNVPLPGSLSMTGATLTVTVADESATATLSGLSSGDLPSCAVTCNY